MFSDFAQNSVAFFVVYSFLFSALFCPAWNLRFLSNSCIERGHVCVSQIPSLEGRHVCGEFVQWEVFVFICLGIHSCWHESYEISCWHECQTWEHGGWQDTVHQEHHCLKNYDCGAMIEHFNILTWRNVGVPNTTSVEQVWRIHIQNHIIHKAESLLFWVVCWDFCPCARDQWITWKIGCIIASCGELHVCRR